MEINKSYFLDFPKDFCGEIKEGIEAARRKRINVQLVGLAGSGKSLILRSLLLMDGFYGVDGNLFTEKKVLDLTDKLEEFKQKGEIGVVLVDSVKDELMNTIMSLYGQYRNHVIFVFSTQKEIQIKSRYEVIYIEPWKKSDMEWFLESLVGESGVDINSTVINEIIVNSGGFAGIAKRLFELVVAGETVEKIGEQPWRYTRLAYQLESIVKGVGVVRNDYIELFKKYYLVDKNGNFLSKVLENFVKHLSEAKSYLTAEEHKLMVFLEKNKGEIVDREKIIVAIWGENANGEIADHALDQLMHRLRNKVKIDGVEIETVRGRGYILR